MATKVFIVVSSGDPDVSLEVGLVYPLNAKKKGWMDEVKVIFFGPSEKLLAYDKRIQERVKELQETGVEVLACIWCAERMNITGTIEALGVPVLSVGPVISLLLKEGWASLSF